MTWQRQDEAVRHVSAKSVAKALGVDVEVIAGLVRSGKVRGYTTTGKTGHAVTRVEHADYLRLLAVVRGGTP